MDYQKSIETIANHYGLENQSMMLIEECSELIKAICKYERNPQKKEYEAVVEEIADVQIMLDQIISLFNDAEKDVDDVMRYKIDRQLKRIEEEHESIMRFEFND